MLLSEIKEYRTKTQAERLNMTGLELLAYNNEKAMEEEEVKVIEELELTSQLRLELPLGVDGSDLEVTQDYVTQTIDVKIPFANEEYFYEYPMIGKSDNIDNLTYESYDGYGIIEFVTNKVYELDTSFDSEYYYIDFLKPKEIYDKVVVIDAGHGGSVPGATKQGIYEKDLNLAIVLQLKNLFEEAGNESIKVYYTRTEDVNPNFEHRVNLANNTEADLFISVHNNSTQSGRMSSICGTQVMYDELKSDEVQGSKRLAQICLEEVTASAESSNKGLVEGNEIYIVRSSEVPVALIEVGFMTNQEELDKLQTIEYQKKVATGIYNAIERAFAEGF